MEAPLDPRSEIDDMVRKLQIIFLWIGIIGAVVAGLFPPWIEVQRESVTAGEEVRLEQREVPVGFHFIASPPFHVWDEQSVRVRIDYGQLTIEWILIGLVTSGLVWALRGKPHS